MEVKVTIDKKRITRMHAFLTVPLIGTSQDPKQVLDGLLLIMGIRLKEDRNKLLENL